MIKYFFGTSCRKVPSTKALPGLHLNQKGITVDQLTAYAFALNVFGAVLGSLAACLYALRVWRKIEKANLATWSVVWVLDFVGFYLTYVTGNKEPYIQVGWCIAATFILIAAWLRRGIWRWTNIESITLAITAASVTVWVMGAKGEVAVLALSGYIAACFVSVWPQARDYVRHPDMARKSAWVWQVSVIAILFPLAAKYVEDKTGVEHTLVYWALIGLNVIMSALCMRRSRRAMA